MAAAKAKRAHLDEHALALLEEMLGRLEMAEARALDVGQRSALASGGSKHPAMTGFLLAECSTSAGQLRLALGWLKGGE